MEAEFQDFTDQMLPCKGQRSKRPRASPPVGLAVDSSPSGDGDGTNHPHVLPPIGLAVDSSPSGDGDGDGTKHPQVSPSVGLTVDSSPSGDGDGTKHSRMSPPVGLTIESSPSGDGGGGSYSLFVHSPASSCSQMSTATKEDETMAHCLILLARTPRSGCPKQDAGDDVKVERISCRKSTDTAAATVATTSVYECKTCNRKFPSFQALGGHRASHSKPKLMPEDHKKSTPFDHHHHDHLEIQDKTHEKSNKTKIHKCSICGSLFFSGQALGGHMRRHRPLHINTTTTMKASMDDDDDDQEKPKPVFTLDLNLPAPDDDEVDDEDNTIFEFSDKQQSSTFSTPAMVDCHY